MVSSAANGNLQRMTTTAEDFLTVPEVAARLRVSSNTVRRMIAAGELPAVRLGKQYRIEASQLQATVDHHRTSQPLVVRPVIAR